MITNTPNEDYYVVIFTSIRSTGEEQAYEQTAQKLMELAQVQDGFLGFEHAREELGISLSYWRDQESILNWKNQADHLLAQAKGKQAWYNQYSVRIAKVERQYHFIKDE